MVKKKPPAKEVVVPSKTRKSHKFGWCADGHHNQCRYEYAYYELKEQCSCSCHEENNDNSKDN